MIRAAHDFSLCTRRPQSCSLHATCARAQMTSGNPQRQRFAWPADTGERCPIFHDYAPYRKLAAMGGGIADTLAEPENLGRPEQSGAASRENSGGSGSAFTIPALSGSHRQATTEHPAACGTISAGEPTQLRAARVSNI